MVGSAVSEGTLVKEISTSKADEKDIERVKKQLKKIGDSGAAGEDIFLAALVRVSAEIIDNNLTKQKG